MIELFCNKLPRELSNQMYNEFYSRMSEIKFLMEYDYYKKLKNDLKVIEMLLATSIFYKRVILNLESATKFSNNVYSKTDADTIRIGSYDLTSKENRRISAVVRNYKELMRKYSIPLELINYTETKVFLKGVVNYKRTIENIEKNDNKSDDGKSV